MSVIPYIRLRGFSLHCNYIRATLTRRMRLSVHSSAAWNGVPRSSKATEGKVMAKAHAANQNRIATRCAWTCLTTTRISLDCAHPPACSGHDGKRFVTAVQVAADQYRRRHLRAGVGSARGRARGQFGPTTATLPGPNVANASPGKSPRRARRRPSVRRPIPIRANGAPRRRT